MPIIEFENYDEAPLVLVIEPWGHQHQVQELARAGIRYSPSADAEDRCFSGVSGREIELWLNADTYEIDIVPPSPSDMLLWDMCVRGGWCGGIIDDKRVHVRDLLPTSGPVTAQAFAKLAAEADGGGSSKPANPDHLQWLEAKFVEHLGSWSVDSEVLRQTARRPFDSDAR